MASTDPAAEARKKAEFIMKVRCGLMSATQAAEALGVSRKTYYQWERRGLAGMLESVSAKQAGRPETPPSRASPLEKQLAETLRENHLLKQKLILKDLVSNMGSGRTEKNERIMQTVAHMEKINADFGLGYREPVAEAGFSYASFMRWRQRIASGKPPLRRPGPKKISPLNLGDLTREIKALDHGRKRSRGAGGLHKSYKDVVSRRELNAMITSFRREENRKRDNRRCRVIWHQVDLVWALDGYEYAASRDTLHVANVQDLCAVYKFPPLAAGALPCGEEVAGHLVGSLPGTVRRCLSNAITGPISIMSS